MMRIVLDSGPLGLSVHRVASTQRDECRNWMARRLAAGDNFFVPEIVDYELRRELLRLKHYKALESLDLFTAAIPDRKLILKSNDLRLAAELWAKTRQQGTPTADPHALDVDVILCAQVLNAGFDPNDVVVATSNVKHISQFVNAREWTTI